MTVAAQRRIDAFPEGSRAQHRYEITPQVYRYFLAAFEDTNPLHVDDDFARARGFPQLVTHGAILNGFISHFVGVYFPGGAPLEHSVSIQFKSPCHIGDQISIEATVTQVSTAVEVVTVSLVLKNLTRNRIAARAKVQMGIG